MSHVVFQPLTLALVQTAYPLATSTENYIGPMELLALGESLEQVQKLAVHNLIPFDYRQLGIQEIGFLSRSTTDLLRSGGVKFVDGTLSEIVLGGATRSFMYFYNKKDESAQLMVDMVDPFTDELTGEEKTETGRILINSNGWIEWDLPRYKAVIRFAADGAYSNKVVKYVDGNPKVNQSIGIFTINPFGKRKGIYLPFIGRLLQTDDHDGVDIENPVYTHFVAAQHSYRVGVVRKEIYGIGWTIPTFVKPNATPIVRQSQQVTLDGNIVTNLNNRGVVSQSKIYRSEHNGILELMTHVRGSRRHMLKLNVKLFESVWGDAHVDELERKRIAHAEQVMRANIGRIKDVPFGDVK